MIRRRKYIRYSSKSDEPVQKKSVWHHLAILVLMIVFAICTVSMQGCAAPKSREQRAIIEWQTEGHYVYRVEDGIEYFVKCEGGLKYIGVHKPSQGGIDDGYYNVVGPLDTCTGEEE